MATKAANKAALQSSDLAQVLGAQRDLGLSLFHALGKFLYNKRDAEGEGGGDDSQGQAQAQAQERGCRGGAGKAQAAVACMVRAAQEVAGEAARPSWWTSMKDNVVLRMWWVVEGGEEGAEAACQYSMWQGPYLVCSRGPTSYLAGSLPRMWQGPYIVCGRGPTSYLAGALPRMWQGPYLLSGRGPTS